MKRVILLAVCVLIVPAPGLTVSALADDEQFSTLYTFDAPAPVTYTSPLGSQPDTRPVLGPGNTVYGMTYDGGINGKASSTSSTCSRIGIQCCIRSAHWMRTETTRTEPIRVLH